LRTTLAILCLTTCLTSEAQAVFIDLRGLTISNPGNEYVSAGPVSVLLDPNVGDLTSSTTRFGIDAPGSADVPDLLDGGSGVSESLIFLFLLDVFVDSIVISEFDSSDAGVARIKGHPEVALGNGVNDLGGIRAGATSGNAIVWQGPNTSGGDLGFSIDGFNVRLTIVPEPSSLFLSALAGLMLIGWRTRSLG